MVGRRAGAEGPGVDRHGGWWEIREGCEGTYGISLHHLWGCEWPFGQAWMVGIQVIGSLAGEGAEAGERRVQRREQQTKKASVAGGRWHARGCKESE